MDERAGSGSMPGLNISGIVRLRREDRVPDFSYLLVKYPPKAFVRAGGDVFSRKLVLVGIVGKVVQPCR
jgi:hypothetical protein